MPNLRLAGDPAADALLDENPMALLIGMLLDQPNMIVLGQFVLRGLCGGSLSRCRGLL